MILLYPSDSGHCQEEDVVALLTKDRQNSIISRMFLVTVEFRQGRVSSALARASLAQDWACSTLLALSHLCILYLDISACCFLCTFNFLMQSHTSKAQSFVSRRKIESHRYMLSERGFSLCARWITVYVWCG